MLTALVILYTIIATAIYICIFSTLDYEYNSTGRKRKTVLTLAIAAGIFWPIFIAGLFVVSWIEKALGR